MPNIINRPKGLLKSIFLANPKSMSIVGGFWAVILSRAAWKKSWVGRDPTHSIIPMDRSVAITERECTPN